MPSPYGIGKCDTEMAVSVELIPASDSSRSEAFFISIMTYSEKLKDPRWQKRRLEILSRDNFICQWCLDTETTLHVHHLFYEGKNPWDTDDDLLITICEQCHNLYHKLNKLEAYLWECIRNRDKADGADAKWLKGLRRVIINNMDNG